MTVNQIEIFCYFGDNNIYFFMVKVTFNSYNGKVDIQGRIQEFSKGGGSMIFQNFWPCPLGGRDFHQRNRNVVQKNRGLHPHAPAKCVPGQRYEIVHFFYVQGKWAGVLHHVVNSHEWVDVIGSGETECMHSSCEEDNRDAPWLEPDSKPHQDLRAVVLETRLLNTLKYYVNFR